MGCRCISIFLSRSNVNGILTDCLAGNLATNKDSLEITTDIPASEANDGDGTTYSCTEDNEAFPWWAVDLEQAYSIGKVVVNLPSVGGDTRNYHLLSFVR